LPIARVLLALARATQCDIRCCDVLDPQHTAASSIVEAMWHESQSREGNPVAAYLSPHNVCAVRRFPNPPEIDARTFWKAFLGFSKEIELVCWIDMAVQCIASGRWIGRPVQCATQSSAVAAVSNLPMRQSDDEVLRDFANEIAGEEPARGGGA
jgi:hypothetical protein